MFCNECGTRNNQESKYCKHCGNPLGVDPGPEPVDVLLEHSYQARLKGDTEKALAMCKLVLIKTPNHTSALALLGQLYETLGNKEEAIAAYEQVVRLNPGSIADRIKLDQLKGTVAHVAPHIPAIEKNHPPQQKNNAVFTLILVNVLVLALIGTGLALIVSLTRPPAEHAQLPAASPTANSRKSASPQAASQNVASAPVYPFSLPPTIIYTPPSTSSYAPANINPASTLPDPAKPPVPLAAAHSPAKSSAAPGHFVIDVGSSQSSHVASAITPPDTHSHISISVGGSSSQALQPDHTSRSYMAMAENEQLAAHYQRAVSAYQDALPTAGDETGFIYQQIGSCYQRLTKRSLAIQNYQNAIAAFNKMIAANRHINQAKAGILVCQASIKACTL